MPKRKPKSDPDAPVIAEVEVTDTPPTPAEGVDNFVYPPDFRLTEPQKNMIALVAAGATPGTAATVTGLDDDYKLDIKFARHINQLHAYNIARVEQAAFDAAAIGKSVPAGIAFWLKCVAGWRDKYGDDGFAQHIEIQVEAVDGYRAAPAEDADE